ncbi:D-alanyl-D-alanine carboxypeptidase [Pseudooceanicola sp. GBMRC 2024]|uniref:D-alanyl-D-alanine carboxypeptidase n=2 Tax=Paracoccaceae TaxID=31989 RepID=A0A6L7GAA6_9RHOB|nr:MULTISPECIES: D-alanyl-D-alanine carboxypeptidase family protein [Pseudooceanicola]MXN20468.1 D-alanyl-D-alanine carboxypeptidase [Pseudooceanicola albus]
MVLLGTSGAKAAPYAALVMDARTGQVLYEKNADTPLHPASLTKMMTLYITFEAIKNGEITLDTPVTISRHAAGMEPSKLGMRVGQKIKLRYLIRAAAVKSANDAATAIGEAIEGSEPAFAARMNRTAKALGMKHSHFVNMNGLTAAGHLSSARDMTILGRHLLFDYPQYYNLFSRRSANAGGKTVYNTNRRLLNSYEGADGIKTGYTSASGSNLVASARRGNVRIIATVFGGHSSAWRDQRVKELLDLGFRKAPRHARTVAPGLPNYNAGPALVAANSNRSLVVATSLRPQARPGADAPAPGLALVAAAAAQVDPDLNARAAALALASAAPDTAIVPPTLPRATASATAIAVVDTPEADVPAVTRLQPVARPSDLMAQFPKIQAQAAPAVKAVPEASAPPAAAPAVIAAVEPPATPASATTPTHVQTDKGARLWGVNVGRFPSQYSAEKAMLTTAMTEVETLGHAERQVSRGATGFDALFTGLTRDAADRTCQRLNARNQTCFMIGPDT